MYFGAKSPELFKGLFDITMYVWIGLECVCMHLVVNYWSYWTAPPQFSLVQIKLLCKNNNKNKKRLLNSSR